MSRRKKPVNTLQKIIRHVLRLSKTLTKGLMNWLLRSLMLLGRRRSSNLGRAGFVLPTVIMVMLVVILLTTAIMIRSFDRSKNASNYRVNEAVLNATQPALDRAKAKIDRLFSTDESRRQGNTPPEFNIAEILESNTYIFGDEIQLTLTADFVGGFGADRPEETLRSAWKFPVDTDNNGKFDSYTLYGIYFRYPEARRKGPLEARALPMDDGSLVGCSIGAGNIGGWYNTGGKSKKAFFTYVATVPITEAVTADVVTKGGNTIPAAQFETYRGNQGFSALEMQQDQARIALDNNAVWYDDDIQIGNAPDFRLNGRVHTNSNLMLQAGSEILHLHQVSSRFSCYYDPDNAKIVVGGNVSPADIRSTAPQANPNVRAFLFRGAGTDPEDFPIDGTNRTTTAAGATVAYNNKAYDDRIDVMVNGAINLFVAANNVNAKPEAAEPQQVNSVPKFPLDLKKYFKERNESGEGDLRKVLDAYFRQRTRRVPYAEVAFGGAAIAVTANPNDANFVFGNTNPIRPPLPWMLIEDPANGTVDNYTKLPLRIGEANAQPMDLETTDPDLIQEKREMLLGDRILVGNNLPYYPYNTADDRFESPETEQSVFRNGTEVVQWNETATVGSGSQRKRRSRVEVLDDLGDTSRNGFWERAAAKTSPAFDQEQLSGGLRVVTGAGIYIDGVAGGTGVRDPGGNGQSFLPEPPQLGQVQAQSDSFPIPNDAIVVWPDTMPMYRWDDDGNGNFDLGEEKKGDLQMRATVVYHYADNAGTDQTPIACISSYYDPTNQRTANNINGVSNNGKVYGFPGRAIADPRLARQAKMVFPNGRWANRPLFEALFSDNAGTVAKPAADRTLTDNAAIDAAVCALSILDGAGPSNVLPDGAIKEAAFLDSRQVKALHKQIVSAPTTAASPNPLEDASRVAGLQVAEKRNDLTTRYDLAIEQRQPLEIRVTEIDLDVLRQRAIGSGEFLLPNSGIIYASRDDALPDISAGEGNSASATDFRLDPTRRPNGIRLIEGANLARGDNNQYRADEKGLILTSDLPVYIKGEFNRHRGAANGTLEEFTTALNANYNNFYTRTAATRNPSFACRQGQEGCDGVGDQWRAARILSDAVTLLSETFRDGFRSDGDYDLNNNAGNLAVEARLRNGFWWNGFATSRGYWNSTPNSVPEAAQLNSYLANGVTPIQRRANFPEYIMEICRKLPVSECTPTDWVVGYDNDGTPGLDALEKDIKANALATTLGGAALDKAKLGAGTTALPALDPADRRYPRRVAFARDASNNLVGTPYQPLGVGCPLNGCIYGGNTEGTHYGTPANNALWFWTTTSDNNPGAIGNRVYAADRPLFYLPPLNLQGQPLLVPVLQLHSPGDPNNNNAEQKGLPGDEGSVFRGYINDHWMQHATETTYNAAFVMGDSPARPANTVGSNAYEAETGGGLINFPRFLESWEVSDGGALAAVRINGSFIQFKKSIFATAPFEAVDSFRVDNSLFFDNQPNRPVHTRNIGQTDIETRYVYRGGGASRRAPYYRAPQRAWGYDVGLLSQTPDLFSKRFATPDVGTPNEYYREVGRDDPWVQTLLCGVYERSGTTVNAVDSSSRPGTCLGN
jgi:type II secretory pathway pseudopilin PulG